jgi:hypothetical protein
MAGSLDAAAVDAIIEKLLSVRNARPGKEVQLSEDEIRGLCMQSREIFLGQPMLLELEAPIKVCGREGHAFFLKSYASSSGFDTPRLSNTTR